MSNTMKRLPDGPTGLENWQIELDFTTDPVFGSVLKVTEPMVLSGVHPQFVCEGRECVIHNPTNHHMREWPLLWRADRAIFERLCPHGVGHPDPDQIRYWREMAMEYEEIHGCDGCCRSSIE